jgi:putative transposase
MTQESSPLAGLLQKATDGGFLRSVAEAVVQMLMEADVDGVIGAGRHKRSAERNTYRDGLRSTSRCSSKSVSTIR